MSIKIMNEAWEVQGIDPTAKLVLMCVADMANEDDRTAWPAVRTIARKCGVSRRTVQYHLRRLEKMGHISLRRERTGDSTLYRIHPQLDAGERVRTQADEGGANMTPLQPIAPGGATHCTQTLTEPLQSPLSEKTASSQTSPHGWEEFWDQYPRKTGKGQALRAFKAASKKTNVASIMEGLQRAVYAWGRAQTPTHYIPHPATWLNGERWLDDAGAIAERGLPTVEEMMASTEEFLKEKYGNDEDEPRYIDHSY